MSKHKAFTFRKGQAALEFVALAFIVIAALTLFYPHIRNHVSGRWHASGDAWSWGMAYDGDQKACGYQPTGANSGFWYDKGCYFSSGCDNDCMSSTGNQSACMACLMSCGTSSACE